MSDFTVFEEAESEGRACQTEEITSHEQSSQTYEYSLTNDENAQKIAKNPEISYLEAVVENFKAEIDRFQKINDKMEREKTAKKLELEHKKAEYNRLFEFTSEKLSKEEEEEPEQEEPEQQL